MVDTEKTPAMLLLDQLAARDPPQRPQLCGLWPRRSPGCPMVGTPLTRS